MKTCYRCGKSFDLDRLWRVGTRYICGFCIVGSHKEIEMAEQAKAKTQWRCMACGALSGKPHDKRCGAWEPKS